ncbi:MAG: HEAT repeat domain-containing protein [Bryobacteraceae bacterium]
MNRRGLLVALLIWLALSVAPALGQVKVSVTLNRIDYLVGEPIFVIVEATNTGTEAVGYSKLDGRNDLKVPAGQRKQVPNLHGCPNYSLAGGGFGGGIDHPPLLAPGKSVSFRYLLEGYRLQPGDYELHASGKAGVRWFFGMGRGRSSVSNKKQGDPVEGATFDVRLSFSVSQGTEDDLKARYAPLVQQSQSGSGMFGPGWEAREAIAEMAPPFLEKTILGFAHLPWSGRFAAKGLGQIDTSTSRADLVELYEHSVDLQLRADIVEALAGIATSAELPFLASLIPGHSGIYDDRIRIWAILGVGRVGGEKAVEILKSAPRSPTDEVRHTVVTALGNTRSKTAIPVLIEMYADETVRYRVCDALSTLTHRAWCDGTHSVAGAQVLWQGWFKDNQSTLKVYGNDQCVERKELAPLAN